MQERLRRAEEAMQDTDPHMQIAEEPEQPDTIDTISDTVAQHIGFSDSIRPPFLFAEKQEQEVQEPEQAEDCTMAIPKPELSEKPDEPEEVDTSTMFLPKADIIQQEQPEQMQQPDEQPEPDEQPDQKKSLFADMFDMFQEEADEPEEYEPEPVLAEQRSAQPAEKFSLEQLLMDDEGAVNPVKRSEPQERPDEQPELTPEQAEQRKQRVLTAVFAVVIVAASLVFAAFGVQHVEVLLALCFCMYLGMRYRLAAFGFAVLAVRRLYDAIVLLMQGGHLLEALTDGCICVIFITLTLHMLRTYANSKNQADADETE